MNWSGLNSALANLNQFFTEYMSMIFLLYLNQLDSSHNFIYILIDVILICLFHLNRKTKSKLSFLDVEVFWQQGKFVASVYRKPIFSGVHAYFDSFLPMIYKFGLIYSLAYRYFNISSDCIKFDEEISFLKQVLLKN